MGLNIKNIASDDDVCRIGLDSATEEKKQNGKINKRQYINARWYSVTFFISSNILNHTYLLSKIATNETPCHQIIEQYILITEIAVVTVAYGATFVCYLLVP